MTRIGLALVSLASVAAAQPPPGTGSVRGIVIDSLLGNGPLVGATIELVELGRVTTSDVRGLFRFDSLPGGRYTVAFTHPSLASIGFSPPDRNRPSSKDWSTVGESSECSNRYARRRLSQPPLFHG